MSALFFCRHCGEVFAKCPIITPEGRVMPWQSFARCCEKCRPPGLSEWPGSLWLSWDEEFCEALPMPVLQQELQRHLDCWERNPNGYS